MRLNKLREILLKCGVVFRGLYSDKDVCIPIKAFLLEERKTVGEGSGDRGLERKGPHFDESSCGAWNRDRDRTEVAAGRQMPPLRICSIV